MDALTDSLNAEVERRRILLEADPFGEGIVGGFFGGDTTPFDLPNLSRFERMGTDRHKFVLHMRSLPTRDVVSFVVERCGDRARALMEEWRGLFGGLLGGPEGLAELSGFKPEFDYAPPAVTFTPRTLFNMAGGKAGFGEANELYAAMALEPPPARRPEQHFLEDASVMTALVRHRIPVAFAAFNGDFSSVRLLTFGKRGKPRVVQPSRREAEKLYRGFLANNSYWLMSSFTSLCGRRMVETVGTRHLTLTLLDMARQGHVRAFLKDTLLKGGTWVVDLDGVGTEQQATTRLIEAIGPNWYSLLGRVPIGEDGDVRRMVVQEFTPFDREHRFFCIGGRIAASTASDRSMTVFDAPPVHRRLDCRVAVLERPAKDGGSYDRGSTYAVEDRALVAKMARLVRRMLREIKETDFIGRALLSKAFVVDVGSGPGGIGLIEINTFRNAGLYGVDYDRIARSMKTVDKWPDWIRAFESDAGGKLKGDDGTLSGLGQVARWVVSFAPPEVAKVGAAGVWGLVETVGEMVDAPSPVRMAAEVDENTSDH